MIKFYTRTIQQKWLSINNLAGKWARVERRWKKSEYLLCLLSVNFHSHADAWLKWMYCIQWHISINWRNVKLPQMRVHTARVNWLRLVFVPKMNWCEIWEIYNNWSHPNWMWLIQFWISYHRFFAIRRPQFSIIFKEEEEGKKFKIRVTEEKKRVREWQRKGKVANIRFIFFFFVDIRNNQFMVLHELTTFLIERETEQHIGGMGANKTAAAANW